jgi:hypothetical protein
MKYMSPAPLPAHRSFADHSGNILGSKLCTGAGVLVHINDVQFL